MTTALALRPATADDEAAIRALVRETRLNPLGLNWQRFTVAEWAGEFAGCVQAKPRGDRLIELASLAVVAKYRGRGIGGALIRHIIATTPQTVHLMCEPGLQGYYGRFGFEPLAVDDMPQPFRRLVRLVQFVARFIPGGSGKFKPAIMKREYSVTGD